MWAFHNENDPVYSIDDAEALVDGLVACGGDATLTTYASGPHDAWTETYAKPDLYAWFLAH